MSPSVSVIIPCLNAATSLPAAIESCLQQSWADLEIIIVDNGSSDASLSVARRYESPSVRILECGRPGASAARNEGLKKASGEFIQFLDADDMLDRDKIRIQMERLTRGPKGSVASGAWSRFRHRAEDASILPEPVWRDLLPAEFLISSWLGGGMMPNFAWLTPRATIDRAGPWNESLSVNDDGEFFCRVVLASSAILFCRDARGHYRTTTASTLSRRRDEAALSSSLAAIELSCEALLNHCNSPAVAKACAAHYQRFVFDTYPDAPHLVAVAERRVEALGGSDLQTHGGRLFQIISRSLGWKFAKRCQRAWYRMRIDRAF